MAEEGKEFDFSPFMQLIAKDSPVTDLALHQCLNPEGRNTFCVLQLVLRALDTVEDEMNIPSDIKVPILENFHRHIYDSDLQLSCGTKIHHKDLMDQYHHVATALSELQEDSQKVIVEITKRMGAGMAKFILKEVETVDDYNEYLPPPPDHLSSSMGLLNQKQHIVLDFMEDMSKIPKAPMYWPRQIWSKYVDELGDLASEENSENAICCLNDMVTDALSHAESCLEYLSVVQDPGVLRFCATPQIISIGMLALCMKIRHAIRLCAKVTDEMKSMSDVYGAFYDILGTLKTKINNNDPNTTKTLSLVEAIQNVCENSGLLIQRGSLRYGGESKEQVGPFSLVANEISLIGNRLRDMVVAQEMGVEGKRFRPTVLLLMASALNVSLPGPLPDAATCNYQNIPQHQPKLIVAQVNRSTSGLRTRHQRVAKFTEMIHVESLLHDDVLDDADTRRGVPSLNYFLLSRACVALASLENTEVAKLLSTVVEHLVIGEILQMSSTSEQPCNIDQYMKKTFYKTALLIANSCKAIYQETEVAMLAYNYGRNLGLAFQLIDDIPDFIGTTASLGKGSLSDIHGIITAPTLFAIEEFPQLQEVTNCGFDIPANVDLTLEYLGRSRGIQRARELVIEHANLAASAIDCLPQSEDDNVIISRRALVELTHIVITRTK
ncbi:hypothetical protein MKX01_004381 [Papaver californicum]|nr:hypothetical protein MKX01_004381 [Papaver californicum]